MFTKTYPKILIKQLISNNLFVFSSKNKSYYQILDVKQNCSPKQLRGKFLKKARLLHPDHNDSPQAQQQFKILKQAYQTLKDPQKRYMYDTGISVEPGQQTEMHRDYQTQAGRKYYENRWYRYQKSQYKDARDEFYTQRNQFIEQNPYRNRIVLFISLIIGLFGYDYYYSKSHQSQIENKLTKQLLQQSVQTKKKAVIMKKYIDSRSREHVVQD